MIIWYDKNVPLVYGRFLQNFVATINTFFLSHIYGVRVRKIWMHLWNNLEPPIPVIVVIENWLLSWVLLTFKVITLILVIDPIGPILVRRNWLHNPYKLLTGSYRSGQPIFAPPITFYPYLFLNSGVYFLKLLLTQLFSLIQKFDSGIIWFLCF